jgi:FkbM family methyltransferase
MKSQRNIIVRSLGRMKWSVEKYFMHNFFLYFYAKKLFHIIPWLLPHEKDYFGLKLLLGEGDGLFLDIGANDGVSALSFRRINTRYAILSLEPNPLHRKSLERVKARIERFDFRLCAAGEEAGTATLRMPTYKGIPNHSGSFCAPEQQGVFEALFPPEMARKFVYVSQTVPVIRVDDLHVSPTVVKIDAEGYDLKIIRGMEETIRRCRPILMVENNPSNIEVITAFLADLDYQVREYDYQNDCLVPYAGGRTRNVFFTSKQSKDPASR